jgi:replicative DNA helicase
MVEIRDLWKPYDEMLEESISYVDKRRTKEITSLKTCWKSFNNIGLNGVEWHSIYTIAARPGVGKTLISASLTRSLLEINTDQDFAVLHFQFEMLGRNMALRELSSVSGLQMRYILSAEDDEKLNSYVKSQKNKRNEYVVDTALTVEQMRKVVYAFYKEYKKPFVITLDHTLLVKRGSDENSRNATLENLSSMMTQTKKALPITWIVLTQLNREIDSAERQIPGKLSNYPTEADVFGTKQKKLVP